MARRSSGWTAVTANVNGVRAAARRGGLAWLKSNPVDLVCLQEVRATHEQLHEVLDEAGLGGLSVAHSPAAALGRSGVAVLSPHELTGVRVGLGHPEFEDQGRWIEADVASPLGPITAVSVYVHTGDERGSMRCEEKLRFLEAMGERLGALHRRAKRRKGHVIVSGDINVAHREIDIKNWKGNRGKAGFLEEEREHLDRWAALGYVDLGRHLGGPGPGPYTWWSWRGKGFDTDGGWRIDYTLASAGLAASAQEAVVGKAATYAERWSDHAPLTVRFSTPD